MVKKRPPLKKGVFYTTVNGRCTDVGIVDEYLDEKITDELKQKGFIRTFPAKVKVPNSSQ